MDATKTTPRNLERRWHAEGDLKSIISIRKKNTTGEIDWSSENWRSISFTHRRYRETTFNNFKACAYTSLHLTIIKIIISISNRERRKHFWITRITCIYIEACVCVCVWEVLSLAMGSGFIGRFKNDKNNNKIANAYPKSPVYSL